MKLTIANEFALDVLEILKSRKVTFHGCPPWYLEQHGTTAKMWFAGHRKGKEWAGAITVMAPDVENSLAVGNSTVLADLLEKIIDENHTRFE